MMPWDERRERTLETLVAMEYASNNNAQESVSSSRSSSPSNLSVRADRDRMRDIESMLNSNKKQSLMNHGKYLLMNMKTKEEHVIRTPHTRVGTKEANLPQDIILEDNNNDILPEHCVFVVETNRVTAFSAPDACTFVDDVRITDSLEPTPLSDGMMIRFGNTYVFQFIVRTESLRQEEEEEEKHQEEREIEQHQQQQQIEQQQKDEAAGAECA